MITMKKIKEFLNPQQDENIGTCWIEEILPKFHDYARTTNKTVYVIKENIENNVSKVFDLDLDTNYFSKNTSIKGREVIQQNGIPIKFDKKKRICNNNTNFEKNGYIKDRCIHIKGLGFLGDIENTLKTWIVTDEYVFFKSLDDHPSIQIYSYRELERLNVDFIN